MFEVWKYQNSKDSPDDTHFLRLSDIKIAIWVDQWNNMPKYNSKKSTVEVFDIKISWVDSFDTIEEARDFCIKRNKNAK